MLPSMDEKGAQAMMHNAVEFAHWGERRAQELDPIEASLRSTGRSLSNAEALQLLSTLNELIRRSYNQPILVAALLLEEASHARDGAEAPPAEPVDIQALVARAVRAHLPPLPPPRPWWRRWLRL